MALILLCIECEKITVLAGEKTTLIRLCQKCKAKLLAELGIGPSFAHAETLRGRRN